MNEYLQRRGKVLYKITLIILEILAILFFIIGIWFILPSLFIWWLIELIEKKAKKAFGGKQ
jgi:uncharacterized membrane protein